MPETVYGTPKDWNIVIVGSWNVAILTPEGIATRLFGLSGEAAVEVMVSLQANAPIRVRHGSITVQPSSANLVIIPAQATIEGLAGSSAVGQRALEKLPETPVYAAGLNFRFHFESIPDSLIEVGMSVLDDKLSDNSRNILKKRLSRTVAWQEGILNLDIFEQEDSSGIALFNYHLDSKSPTELSAWLGKSEAMHADCQQLLELIVA